MPLTFQRSSVPGLIASIPTFQRSSVAAFQASWCSVFQRSSVPTFHDGEDKLCTTWNWELRGNQRSSEDELLKSYETVISKIIADQKTNESPSPEYQLCYVVESGSDSDENFSLFPEVFSITSQTIVKVKEQSVLSLSKRIRCRYPNCQLTFKEVRYMEEHYRRKHSEIRVSCSTCGQSFNHRSGLHRHRKKNCWK